MPWPGFSELSFGFQLRELERQHTPGGSFPSAPDFISQNDEALMGYDVEVALKNSVPVFFQFKRSFVLSTHKALPIQIGDFRHPDLYKMYLYKKSNFGQHHALQELEDDGNSVFYVTSQISNFDELTAAYLAKKVVENSAALFSPLEIQLPNLQQDHYLCFRAQDKFAVCYPSKGEGLGGDIHLGRMPGHHLMSVEDQCQKIAVGCQRLPGN